MATTAPATMPGVPMFAKVSDSLYRGAQPTAEGFAQLKKMGVKTVVSLRFVMTDALLLRGLGMRYVHLRLDPAHPEEEDIVDFLKVVEDSANHPIFVHCRQGVDRTGMAVAVYRIVVEGWPREKALAEMDAKGFNDEWVFIERYVKTFDIEHIKKEIAKAKPVKANIIP